MFKVFSHNFQVDDMGCMAPSLVVVASVCGKNVSQCLGFSSVHLEHNNDNSNELITSELSPLTRDV